MHIILEKNINELANDFELQGFTDSYLFEVFCNFCLVSKKFLGRFNPKDVTTGDDDASLDGIAIIIDGELILVLDDAIKIFETHKTNFSVDIIFTQVKSGEAFKKAEITNFNVGIKDFLSLSPCLPNGKLNNVALEIFNVILNNLKKVRNRRPNAYFYYCTSGTYKGEREIDAVFDIIKRDVKETELFNYFDVKPIGRGELLTLWSDISEKNEAKITLLDYFGMPKMPDIPQSYIGIVNAIEFVDKILTDSDGNIKGGVFDENVRAFLGIDNEVNSKIKDTLYNEKKKKLFSVLNNGITIVAPEITLTANSKEIDITNYQIINGCQTSKTLFACRNELEKEVNVIVKFIESPNNDVSTDIISATNNQSDISSESFHGLKKKAKLVQHYFNAKNDNAAFEDKVYFERRESEYKGNGYQSTRVFNVRELSRCYAAMFLNQPHNAARYVNLIFSVSGDNLFKINDHESLYYGATLALYRYNALINGRKANANNYVKVRWHVIQLFKWIVHGKIESINIESKKADAYASKIIKILNSKSKYIELFEECHEIIDLVGFPSNYELKRAKFTSEIQQKASEYLIEKKTAIDV